MAKGKKGKTDGSGSSKRFRAKLRAAKRADKRAAASRAAAKPGSMAKLKKYSTNRSQPKEWALPIGGGPKSSEVIRMRKSFRIDVTNTKFGEQTSPGILFALNDPLAPSMIFGQSMGGDKYELDGALNAKRFAAVGYDYANTRYKRGVVLRSRVVCEYQRRPAAHIAAGYKSGDGSLTEQVVNRIVGAFSGEPTGDNSIVTYEPSPACYVITQTGRMDTHLGRPYGKAGANEWGLLEPPFLQQPKNPLMDSVSALLQRSCKGDTNLKYKLLKESKSSTRHQSVMLYDRKHAFSKGAHETLRDLNYASKPDGATVNPADTQQDEDSDAFFFENATQYHERAKDHRAQITDVPVGIQPEGPDFKMHPRTVNTFRWQAMPEDTAPPLGMYAGAEGTYERKAPPAKALGVGTLNVTIDYVVLCTDPYNTEELQILMGPTVGGTNTETFEQSRFEAMDQDGGEPDISDMPRYRKARKLAYEQENADAVDRGHDEGDLRI